MVASESNNGSSVSRRGQQRTESTPLATVQRRCIWCWRRNKSERSHVELVECVYKQKQAQANVDGQMRVVDVRDITGNFAEMFAAVELLSQKGTHRKIQFAANWLRQEQSRISKLKTSLRDLKPTFWHTTYAYDIYVTLSKSTLSRCECVTCDDV